jgi:transcriptional/translational regulatory protein YebC/TACO1
VKNGLSSAGYKVASAQSNMVPATVVEITSADTAKMLLKLLDSLENHDDVQNVFANFEMDQAWMEQFLN